MQSKETDEATATRKNVQEEVTATRNNVRVEDSLRLLADVNQSREEASPNLKRSERAPLLRAATEKPQVGESAELDQSVAAKEELYSRRSFDAVIMAERGLWVVTAGTLVLGLYGLPWLRTTSYGLLVVTAIAELLRLGRKSSGSGVVDGALNSSDKGRSTAAHMATTTVLWGRYLDQMRARKRAQKGTESSSASTNQSTE